jgi:hypothetical protein
MSHRHGRSEWLTGYAAWKDLPLMRLNPAAAFGPASMRLLPPAACIAARAHCSAGRAYPFAPRPVAGGNTPEDPERGKLQNKRAMPFPT